MPLRLAPDVSDKEPAIVDAAEIAREPPVMLSEALSVRLLADSLP